MRWRAVRLPLHKTLRRAAWMGVSARRDRPSPTAASLKCVCGCHSNPPTQRPQFRKRQPVACALFFGEGSIKALPADEDQSRKQRTQ